MGCARCSSSTLTCGRQCCCAACTLLRRKREIPERGGARALTSIDFLGKEGKKKRQDHLNCYDE